MREEERRGGRKGDWKEGGMEGRMEGRRGVPSGTIVECVPSEKC